MAAQTHPSSDAGTRQRITGWVRAGIITPDQAEAIEHELDAEAGARPVGPSLLVEGLGYLGAAIVVAATLTLTVQFWSDLSSPVRVGVAGAAAVGLLVAARSVVSAHGAGARVRAVLSAAAVAALGAFVAVLGHESGVPHDPVDLAVLVTTSAAAYGGLLWWLNRTLLQQIATYLALLGVAGALARQLGGPDQLFAVGPWAVGVAWLLLAWGGVVRPRAVTEAMGSAGAVIAALVTMGTTSGEVLAVLTAVALVAVAVLVQNLAVLAIASLGTLVSVTVTVSDWFPGALGAPAALLVVGGSLVAVAVSAARRRAVPRPSRRWESGSRRTAIAAAGSVVVAAAVVVIAIAS